MKKIRGILLVFSVLYSGLAAGGSAIYFGFKGKQTGSTINNTKSGQTISMDIDLPSLGGDGTVLGVPECNGVQWINYYTAYFHRIGIPKTINVGGHWVELYVNAPSYQIDTATYDYYYYKSYNNNGGKGFWYSGKACWNAGETTSVNSFAPGVPPKVTVSFRIPPDLPDGVTHIVIPVKYGKNVNFTTQLIDWSHAGDSMNAHTSIDSVDAGTYFLLYTRDIVNKARCSFDKSTYEIDHKNVNMSNALKNNVMAEASIKLTCTVPTDVKIKLSTPKPSNYSNGYFSVDLGNGWDSVISLDNSYYDKSNPQSMYVTQSGRTIKIGSKLYGEASKVKPGSINGSLVMTFDFQ
ncbi:TPA: adhesin [Escherichia coli]|nr:adhesin [Escherichia coli]